MYCISLTNRAFRLQNLHFTYKSCISDYKLAFQLQKSHFVLQMRLLGLQFSFKACGDFLAGRALIDKYLKKWTKAKKMEEPGYFGTTPFFISYIDSPKDQREAYYSYLLGFAYEFTGDNKKAKMSFSEAAKKDRMNIFYDLESKFDR